MVIEHYGIGYFRIVDRKKQSFILQIQYMYIQFIALLRTNSPFMRCYNASTGAVYGFAVCTHPFAYLAEALRCSGR